MHVQEQAVQHCLRVCLHAAVAALLVSLALVKEERASAWIAAERFCNVCAPASFMAMGVTDIRLEARARHSMRSMARRICESFSVCAVRREGFARHRTKLH